MISNDKSEKIKEIWNNFQGANQMVLDTKGNELPNIDELRQEAIKDLSKIITQFKNRTLSLGEFKTSIDSYNNTTVQRNYPIGSVYLNRNHSSDVLV